MTTATLVQRMTKNTKAEMTAATAQIYLDGYTVSADGLRIVCDEDNDGSFYTVLYYRNGDELIAVPDFYIGEESVSLRGSKGGEYRLDNETLVAE
jgi:hypothetical protein